MQHTSAQEIRLAVDRIMIEEFEVEPDALRPEARLAEDLDLDSLDGVDLVVALEKTFSCRIPEEEARGIRTLGDIYARVAEGVHGQLTEKAS
jgi:acyl carrier protein